MPEIIILRHGETEFNLQGRHQSWMDSPLTLKGIEEAHQQGKLLRKMQEEKEIQSIRKIYASDLGRAVQTAKIVSEYLNSPPLEIRKELREHHMGDFDGMTEQEVEKASPGFTSRRSLDRWNVRPPKGENYYDTLARVKPLMERIISESKEEAVLIVAHKAVNRIMGNELLDRSPKEIQDVPELRPGKMYIISNNELKIK